MSAIEVTCPLCGAKHWCYPATKQKYCDSCGNPISNLGSKIDLKSK